MDRIEEVYRLRYVSFRNALAAVTGGQDSAREVVQEAFARALAHREQFRGGSLEAWIWRIAIRTAMEPQPWSGDASLEGRLDLDALVGSALPEPDRDPELAAAIRALAPRRRLIVFLRYFADLDYAAIAEITGVTQGTVAASLAQANACLAQYLQPQGVA